jgi:mannose-1-phosphate guanylyltransferase
MSLVGPVEERLVVSAGVRDLIIVHTEGALLVVHRDRVD